MSFLDVVAKLKNFIESEVEPAAAAVVEKFAYKGLQGGEAVFLSLLDFVVAEAQKRNLAALPLDLVNEVLSILLKPNVVLDSAHGSLLVQVEDLVVSKLGSAPPAA